MHFSHAMPKALPAGQELLRLHVVAAATELAVVCALIDAELTPIRQRAEAEALLASSGHYREDAMDLLAPKTRFEVMSEEQLQATLLVLEVRLAEARQMRESGTHLLGAARQPRPRRRRRRFGGWPPHDAA